MSSRPSARFGRIVDAARATNAVVRLAKREGVTLPDLLRAVEHAWNERCDTCGELYDLHDSNGGRCCTKCADPETVREFLVAGEWAS
jgi:hypothetical protein